jgi:hypothetical protein
LTVDGSTTHFYYALSTPENEATPLLPYKIEYRN